MNKQYLLKFNRKHGNITLTMTSYSSAMLALYVMQNGLKKSEDAVVFDSVSGKIYKYFVGKGVKEMPIPEDVFYDSIEDYCPGILKQLCEV